MEVLLFLLFPLFSRAVLTILNASEQPKFRNPLQIPLVWSTPEDSASVYVTMNATNLSLGLWTTDNQLAYTEVWTYNGTYPGPTFEVFEGQALTVWWDNNLPDNHILFNALDINLDCGPRVPFQNRSGILKKDCLIPQVRTVVHLHGARVQPASDGYPEAWWDNSRGLIKRWSGPFYTFDRFTYLNEQEAATLWYHDHAVGVTRLNVYAGLVGFYLIHDDNEISLDLPSGDYDIPLLIQDKNFTPSGQLQYDHSTNPIGGPLAKLGVSFPFILVNGVTWPYLNVTQTAYRFRLLNGCDGRFLNLSFDGNSDIPVWQIGIDQGLMDTPIRLKFYNPSSINEGLFFGPAERREIVVNFTDVPIGTNLTLMNFDNEDAVVDFPTARLIMQFRVVGVGPMTDPLPNQLRQTNFSVPIQGVYSTDYLGVNAMPDPADYNSIMLVLGVWNFTANSSGQPIGTGNWTWGPRTWDMPTSEFASVGDTKDWFICKKGGGLHPIHVHFLEFEVIGRWNFKPVGPGLTSPLPLYTGDYGPKDMVVLRPDTCVQIRLLFGQPGQYIWHCHILSHEDHDMMRPLFIFPQITTALGAQQLERDNSTEPFIDAANLSSSLEDEAMAQRFVYTDIADDWDGQGAVTELNVAIPVIPPTSPPSPAASGPYSQVQSFVSAHAVLMALTWGLIFPIGAGLMRHRRGGYWAHPVVQMFGLVLLFISAVIAFVKLHSSSNDRIVNVHRALGITIFAVPWINPITGFLLRQKQEKTSWRFFLSKFHTWLIRCVFILAFAQIPVGIYITQAPHSAVVAYVVLIAIAATVVGLLELYSSWDKDGYAAVQQTSDTKERRDTSSS